MINASSSSACRLSLDVGYKVSGGYDDCLNKGECAWSCFDVTGVLSIQRLKVFTGNVVEMYIEPANTVS